MPRVRKLKIVSEETPVDDVRAVRERLNREAGGDIHMLIQQSRAATGKLGSGLGLKIATVSPRAVRLRPAHGTNRLNSMGGRKRSPHSAAPKP